MRPWVLSQMPGSPKVNRNKGICAQAVSARPGLFLSLFLDLDPNAVCASVKERRLEQPNALAIITEALCAQVEMPFGPGQSELISSSRCVGRRGVNRITRRHHTAVLDGLKRMNAGSQRSTEAHRVEFHRNSAVQLE